jgi:hypothetical protein
MFSCDVRTVPSRVSRYRTSQTAISDRDKSASVQSTNAFRTPNRSAAAFRFGVFALPLSAAPSVAVPLVALPLFGRYGRGVGFIGGNAPKPGLTFGFPSGE